MAGLSQHQTKRNTCIYLIYSWGWIAPNHNLELCLNVQRRQYRGAHLSDKSLVHIQASSKQHLHCIKAGTLVSKMDYHKQQSQKSKAMISMYDGMEYFQT